MTLFGVRKNSPDGQDILFAVELRQQASERRGKITQTDVRGKPHRIYAVIQSIAGSSDGKALGMTAPRPIGQLRAMRRAYERAGCSPVTLGLYEAHGTGTPVGDRAELMSMTKLLAAAGAPARSCAIGSAKAHIGHTGSTAGSASLVKAALALHHRTLPPLIGAENPVAALAQSDCPLYLLDEPRPWRRSRPAPDPPPRPPPCPATRRGETGAAA